MKDNPVMFASDGFVAVTGYDRSDIIGKNCRFLQGKDTNQTLRLHIKKSIEDSEEVVEFLTNYKKNGEVFWNLVYIGRFILKLRRGGKLTRNKLHYIMCTGH
jgi:PAS domain S-box-containing protein